MDRSSTLEARNRQAMATFCWQANIRRKPTAQQDQQQQQQHRREPATQT
jgi:hypothetical protein